jgi:uncharacterized membrane protein YoaK (UPF0700 family)
MTPASSRPAVAAQLQRWLRRHRRISCLQGLFTAHVTGNFVTLGASLVLGTSGALAKLLALPVFCAVVIAARWLGTLLSHRSMHPFMPLLNG